MCDDGGQLRFVSNVDNQQVAYCLDRAPPRAARASGVRDGPTGRAAIGRDRSCGCGTAVLSGRDGVAYRRKLRSDASKATRVAAPPLPSGFSVLRLAGRLARRPMTSAEAYRALVAIEFDAFSGALVRPSVALTNRQSVSAAVRHPPGTERHSPAAARFTFLSSRPVCRLHIVHA